MLTIRARQVPAAISSLCRHCVIASCRRRFLATTVTETMAPTPISAQAVCDGHETQKGAAQFAKRSECA